jgi:hypothetical protein
LLLLAVTLLCGCTHPHVRTVEAFERVKDRGDLTAARSYLADDPRVWWEARDGPGSPWTLEAGPWKAWDEHFRGVTRRTSPWVVEGDSVWADMFETNDYYRLTERGGGAWRRTYFFDGVGRIAGTMVGPTDPPQPPAPGRFDEFGAWAREHHPEELAHLMPEGKIDPGGDRPQRFRALLNAWRETVGLQRID